MTEWAKNLLLMVAIAAPIVSAGVILEKVDRAKSDIFRNSDSDARQWQEITKNKVLAARLDERSKCK